MRQSQFDPVLMKGRSGVSGRSLGAIDDGNGPLSLPGHGSSVTAAEGTVSAVFGIGALELSERDRIPRTRGRNSGPRARQECCYAAHWKGKVCIVWSGSRPAQEAGLRRRAKWMPPATA